jgi:hypothetical protein
LILSPIPMEAVEKLAEQLQHELLTDLLVPPTL